MLAANIVDAVQEFNTSPPGQMAAGAAMAGVVWNFFERVETVLTDQTKFEVGVWLVGTKIGNTLSLWPNTFAKMFDRVFGKKHFSWKCFCRSTIASLIVYGLITLWLSVPGNWLHTYRIDVGTSRETGLCWD